MSKCYVVYEHYDDIADILKEFGKLLIENKKINEYKPKLKYWESTFLGKLNNGVYAWIIESANGYTVHPHLFRVKIIRFQ